MVRLLIEEIKVDVQGQSEQVKLTIAWAGGYITHHDLVRTVQRYEQLAEYPKMCQRIEELRVQGKSMEEIAKCLN